MMTSPLRVRMLTNVSADESCSQPIDCRSYTSLAVYLSSVDTTSSGVITIEEADYDPDTDMIYGGTWSTITTINASTFTGGAQLAYHFPSPAAFAFVRVRVSTAIGGGGSISAVLRGV